MKTTFFGTKDANTTADVKEGASIMKILEINRLKIYLAFITLFGLSFLLQGCPKPANQSELKIRMAYQPIVFGLPVFVGEEQKIFQNHGLSVESKSFTSANDMLNALVAGQIDIVPGAPLVPVLALESQYPGRFRIISHSVMTSDKPFDRILVKSGSPITNAKDLSGKKLALIPGTTATNVVKAFLKQQGVDLQSVNFIQLAPTAQLAALESGSVDALYAYEPLVTIALNQNNSFRAITGSLYTSLLDPCPLVVAIVDRNFEKQNPEAVKRAIESFDEIFKFIKEKPNVASTALIPYLKIDPNLAPKVNLQNMTTHDQMQIDNMQKFIDILRDIGEIQSPIEATKLTEETK